MREVIQGVQALDSLEGNEGWEYLSRRFDGYEEQVVQVIAKRLLRGEEVDRDEISFSRGYAAALLDVFTAPERLDAELERAASAAYRRALERADEVIGDESPYL